MTLRTRDKQSKDTVQLLQWVKDLNLGLSTKNWSVLDAQLEQKCFFLITQKQGNTKFEVKAGDRLLYGEEN
jgi:hypothetical protein